MKRHGETLNTVLLSERSQSKKIACPIRHLGLYMKSRKDKTIDTIKISVVFGSLGDRGENR